MHFPSLLCIYNEFDFSFNSYLNQIIQLTAVRMWDQNLKYTKVLHIPFQIIVTRTSRFISEVRGHSQSPIYPFCFSTEEIKYKFRFCESFDKAKWRIFIWSVLSNCSKARTPNFILLLLSTLWGWFIPSPLFKFHKINFRHSATWYVSRAKRREILFCWKSHKRHTWHVLRKAVDFCLIQPLKLSYIIGLKKFYGVRDTLFSNVSDLKRRWVASSCFPYSLIDEVLIENVFFFRVCLK